LEAVVQMKQRNPTWGCPRIVQQMALAFDIPIDKDVVRRILASHYRPEQGSGGPSWLTFIGHLKDSLWSLDDLNSRTCCDWVKFLAGEFSLLDVVVDLLFEFLKLV